MKYALVAVFALLSGCSTTEVYRNPSVGSSVGAVQILYQIPNVPYTSLGIVSAKKYKPGWTDPTVMDAIPQLQEAARSLGADAIVVHASKDGNGTRIVRVEAEAIKFNTTQSQQPSQCVSCGNIKP